MSKTYTHTPERTRKENRAIARMQDKFLGNFAVARVNEDFLVFAEVVEREAAADDFVERTLRELAELGR